MSSSIQVAIAKYHRFGWLINNINVFLTVPEAGKFMFKNQADYVFAQSLLPGSLKMAFSSLFLTLVEGLREISGVSFIRAQSHSGKLSPHAWPDYLPETPLPNAAFRFRFQYMNLTGMQTFSVAYIKVNVYIIHISIRTL